MDNAHPFCAVLMTLWALAAPAAAQDAPPPAPSAPATDVLHGVTVQDPYRNLENPTDPATRAWLQAQGRYAAAKLARIDVRDAIARRLEELNRATGDNVRAIQRMPGGRVYYLTRKAGESQFKLAMRERVEGPERVLVDPQALSRTTNVPHAINHYAPSWDGRTLAYGISSGGSENASLYLMDIATGRQLGEPVPRVLQRAHWAPDSRYFTYNQLRDLGSDAPETETYLDTTVFLLDSQRPEAPPRRLFGPLVNQSLGLDRLDNAWIEFSPDSRWMVARTTDTTVPEGKLFVAPVSALKDDHIPWRAIVNAADKVKDVQLRGDTLYLQSYAGAPRSRVLALSLNDPVLARAKVVVPEPKVGVLSGFGLGPDAIYSEVRAGFNTRVRRHAAGRVDQGVDVAPAQAGTTFLVDDPAHAYRDLLVTSSTWTAPPRVLAIAASGTVRVTSLRNARRPADAPEIEVTEVMVDSHDGVKVPLAILRRKGLPLDGRNPTLLAGYGAYGITFSAWFNPGSLAWLERGGVLAYANVRGSGAFGDAWHRAGFKTTKPNTWKDGVAAARYLIDRKFTSPAMLGAHGGSAGGIFVGRMVTSAPELFAAAVFEVGVLDTIRAEESANGITNISEFGSAKNPAEFPALLEMSTYHQIRDGVDYPAVLLVHGMNDPRVDVWQSGKATARLQTASRSGRPVLLRLDEQAGHGIGSTFGQAISKQADIYSFLLWQFGVVKLRE
jgi:prolyl oligopeptidase